MRANGSASPFQSSSYNRRLYCAGTVKRQDRQGTKDCQQSVLSLSHWQGQAGKAIAQFVFHYCRNGCLVWFQCLQAWYHIRIAPKVIADCVGIQNQHECSLKTPGEEYPQLLIQHLCHAKGNQGCFRPHPEIPGATETELESESNQPPSDLKKNHWPWQPAPTRPGFLHPDQE